MFPKVKDHIDKIIACIIGDAIATPAMEEQIEKIDKAWSMLHSARPRHVVAKVLQKQYNLGKSQAYAIMRDAENLYGQINTVTGKGTRSLWAENFKRLATKAEQAGDLKSALASFKIAAKIEGALETEQTQVQDPNAWLPAPNVEFTSNSQVFIDSQKLPETDFEELNPDAE
jgi:hypothetical protein